jgi:hypothetical protein
LPCKNFFCLKYLHTGSSYSEVLATWISNAKDVSNLNSVVGGQPGATSDKTLTLFDSIG